MKYCINCGAAVPENAKFCPTCGAPLGQTAQQQQAQQNQAQQQSQAQQRQYNPNYNPNFTYSQQTQEGANGDSHADGSFARAASAGQASQGESSQKNGLRYAAGIAFIISCITYFMPLYFYGFGGASVMLSMLFANFLGSATLLGLVAAAVGMFTRPKVGRTLMIIYAVLCLLGLAVSLISNMFTMAFSLPEGMKELYMRSMFVTWLQNSLLAVCMVFLLLWLGRGIKTWVPALVLAAIILVIEIGVLYADIDLLMYSSSGAESDHLYLVYATLASKLCDFFHYVGLILAILGLRSYIKSLPEKKKQVS